MTTDDPAPGLADAPSLLFTSDGCELEAAWSGPADARAVVVLTHPHPAYGGDMHNLVPAALARALPEHGYATLRFNFRGTGASTGEHGGGGAEMADVAAAISAAAALSLGPVLGVGYSFGADVLLGVDDSTMAAVVAIAPPLSVLPLADIASARTGTPTLVLAPEHDQFRPTADAVEAAEDWAASRVRGVPGADHMLAGALPHLVEEITAFFDDVLGG